MGLSFMAFLDIRLGWRVAAAVTSSVAVLATSAIAQDPTYQAPEGLNRAKAGYERLELAGEALPKTTLDLLLAEGKALLELDHALYDGNLPLQQEAAIARKKAKFFEGLSQPEIAQLKTEVTAFKEYLDKNLNPRIDASNDRIKARFARFNRLVDAGFAENKDEFSKQLRQAIVEVEQRIEELEKLKRREAQALRGIIDRVPTYNKALEDWAELTTEARDDARGKAVEAALTIVLLDKGIKLRDQAGLAEDELNALGKQILRPDADPALKETYSAMSDDLRKIRSKEELAEFFERSHGYHSFAKALGKGERAEAAVEIAKLYVKNPTAQLLISDAELLAAVGYAHVAGSVAQREVDTLVNLSNEQLGAVKSYSRMLVRHTDEIKDLREQKQRLEAKK